ncbi:hypothetical protein BJX99DRAFT_249515 [Aspergillus californicus]
MIDRLETNIGRLETHLAELGFDLNNSETAQQSTRLAASDKTRPPPTSPSISDSDSMLQDDTWSLSALSHEGLEWMSQVSGVYPVSLPEDHYDSTPFESFGADFPRKVFCPLPSKKEASSLLYEYLHNFNSLYPLFDQGSLDVPLQSSARWASINVVLALGIVFRLLIKNALGVFHDLCLGQPDLWSIQALLGMPCNFLATTAIRMAHEFGLGEGGVQFSPEDIEYRGNIFWIAYCLVETQSDDDVTRRLPSIGMKGGFNAFRAQCKLATIKGQVYKDLYSTKAKERSLSETMTSVGILDKLLQDWREDLPPEYQPEAQGLPIFPSSISVMLPFLHYSYFNCIITMHQLIACRGIRTADDLVKKKEFSIPNGPSALRIKTILIYYPIVALTALSSTVIQNPVDASIKPDIKLIYQVETFASLLVVSIPSELVARLRTYRANYRAAAEAAVQKSPHLNST